MYIIFPCDYGGCFAAGGRNGKGGTSVTQTQPQTQPFSTFHYLSISHTQSLSVLPPITFSADPLRRPLEGMKVLFSKKKSRLILLYKPL